MHIKNFSQRIIAFSAVIVLFDTLIGAIEIDGNPLSGVDFLATRLASCFLGIYLIIKLDLWATAGLSRSRFWNGILLGIPLLVMGFASGVISNLGQLSGYVFLGVPNLLFFTVGMFLVGLAEEIVYRGLILNNMLKHWGHTYQGVWKSIFVSAAIFGIAHLPNMFFAPILTVIVQAVNAVSGGILFSAIYIRTKNIWAGIAIHALVDWLALIMQVCFTGTSIITVQMSLPQAMILTIAGTLPPLLFAWLYIGIKSKYKTIE